MAFVRASRVASAGRKRVAFATRDAAAFNWGFRVVSRAGLRVCGSEVIDVTYRVASTRRFRVALDVAFNTRDAAVFTSGFRVALDVASRVAFHDA